MPSTSLEPGPLPNLILRNDDSTCEIRPTRGGIVTRCALGGIETLYLDEQTLFDTSVNVRGGVPVLFPVAGRLENDEFIDGTHRYPQKQHGFARTLPWEVRHHGVVGNAAQATFELQASDATRSSFPFSFTLTCEATLSKDRLRLQWKVENNDERPMPLHFGLHPYFHVPLPGKVRARVETSASKAFNQKTMTHEPYAAPDFSVGETTLHLLDHGARGTRLDRGDGRAVQLNWSENFNTLVLWTLPDKPFICVEPWSAPSMAATRAYPFRPLQPKTAETFWFSISLDERGANAKE